MQQSITNQAHIQSKCSTVYISVKINIHTQWPSERLQKLVNSDDKKRR